jgi:hypothetical protein
MDIGLQAERGGRGARSFRRTGGVAAVVLAAVVLLTAPTAYAQPFPAGSQATPLVGSGIVANCPPPTPGAVAGGNATVGVVTVGSPAGGRCAQLAAAADGVYDIAGEPPDTLNLRFSADCTNTGQTGGGVDVPAGTTVPGLGVVGTTTVVTAPNTPVIYPNGTTAILNQVTTTPTSITRSAVVITSGPGAGTVIGRVICGAFVYPLAVDVGGSGATPAIAGELVAGDDGGSRTGLLLLAGGAALVLVIAQLAVARKLRWRGDSAAG